MLDQVKFFRRRQFILGPEYIDYEGWRRITLFGNFLLTLHPDLSVVIAESSTNKAILLGYAIDPYQPELNDKDILQRFVMGEVTIKKVSDNLTKLTGRFVLIINCPQGSWLFHDACGLRQVNYLKDGQGFTWCASQPETLAEHFGFEYDDEVLSYRELAISVLTKEEFWLINERTPYLEIKYLLANHYLDLERGEAVRFWPVPGCIGSLSMDESIKLSSPILQGGIQAAVKRFDLKMGITAGSDSRRSLAAARKATEHISFFTHTPESYGADMEIPVRLFSKLSIAHHKLELQAMNDDFRKYYECSATWARERRGNIAYTALNNFGPNSTVLTNDRSEIHECWNWLPKSKINGAGLAVLRKLNHFFAIREFQSWLNDAQATCDASKMNILVLFDLELRSRWVTSAYSEYDIAYETFCPYNNRHLFCLELSTDERYRRSRQLTFLIKQINHMWPEVLTEPINPPKNIIGKIEQFIWTSIIHKTITPVFPVYDYLRYLKLKRSFEK